MAWLWVVRYARTAGWKGKEPERGCGHRPGAKGSPAGLAGASQHDGIGGKAVEALDYQFTV